MTNLTVMEEGNVDYGEAKIRRIPTPAQDNTERWCEKSMNLTNNAWHESRHGDNLKAL